MNFTGTTLFFFTLMLGDTGIVIVIAIVIVAAALHDCLGYFGGGVSHPSDSSEESSRD
jgi:membrane protein DedA with SNARE-associated domain